MDARATFTTLASRTSMSCRQTRTAKAFHRRGRAVRHSCALLTPLIPGYHPELTYGALPNKMFDYLQQRESKSTINRRWFVHNRT